jgi:hypothetical protein
MPAWIVRYGNHTPSARQIARTAFAKALSAQRENPIGLRLIASTTMCITLWKTAPIST